MSTDELVIKELAKDVVNLREQLKKANAKVKKLSSKLKKAKKSNTPA